MTTFEQLKCHYDNRKETAQEQHLLGKKVIGYTSNTIPVELIEAADFFPVLISSDKVDLPFADKYLEPVFDARIRGIFNSILAGEWASLDLIIIPRTSEPEHKLFLYLIEIIRKTDIQGIPPIYFYDLLHTQNEISENYSRSQTVLLKEKLETISGKSITNEALKSAIENSNQVRRSIQNLVVLRKEKKVSGVEAMTIIGASYFMERKNFVTLTNQFCQENTERIPSFERRRLLIKGYPSDNLALYKKLENDGNIIVAEDDWHGSRCGGNEISLEGDLLENVFQKYYANTPSPRLFPYKKTNEWFEKEALNNIDCVVFYLPPDDDIYGWDYPKQLTFLNEHNIPSILIREI